MTRLISIPIWDYATQSLRKNENRRPPIIIGKAAVFQFTLYHVVKDFYSF